MKQLIVSLILFILPLCSWAFQERAEWAANQQTNTWCSVNLKDGTHQIYVIRGRINIIPTSTSLTLQSPDFQTSYTLQKVFSYHFLTQKEIDAISPATTPDVRILFTSPDEVTIQGIPATQAIRIFSTNGKEYPANIKSINDDNITVSLKSLPAGIYLITLPDTNVPALKVLRQ